MSIEGNKALVQAILQKGCPELQRLRELQTLGWQDEGLDEDYARQRKVADDAAPEFNLACFLGMKKVMKEIDAHVSWMIPRKRQFHFLDLGCCPGGFSSYTLAKNRMATGVGISLPVEQGGHAFLLEDRFSSRYDMYFGDLTSYQLGPSTIDHPRLSELPAATKTSRFDLVFLGGNRLRTQISEYNAPWDVDCLLVSQLVIALQAVTIGGTLMFKLTHPDRLVTAKILYLLDMLAERLVAYKPRSMHQRKGSFYAVALGVGRGVESDRLPEVLHALKELWVEMTFGGEEGKGRFLLWGDLDFAVTTEELHRAYLDRLIELGRGVWDAQAQALHAWFKKKGVMC